MSEKKQTEDDMFEEASSQAESFDANKSGTSETYDMKDFCPGIRIEAKDFDGKWYPAKVSDVDWTENEILVHFENWNTKFDEWIPMDSSRLRPIQKPVSQQKDMVKFSKGEEVMAMWSPYQKYPATIQAVLANDRYDVLFYDGFLKRLKSHKISKLETGIVKSEVKNFTDIGTKEERRERKRKINVAELFHINKRSRKKGLVHPKSQDIKTYPPSKTRNKVSVVKKLATAEDSKEDSISTETIDLKQNVGKASAPGVSHSNKASVDTIPFEFEVKYLNGQTEMWSKQLYQRSEGRTAGKFDIVILNAQGRKFRSRNEIMKYCEENGIIYSHEAFDFSAKGRPKSKPVVHTPPVKPELSAEGKVSLKKGPKKLQQDLAVESQNVGVIGSQGEALGQGDLSSNKVFIGDYEVVIENGKFICPVKICAKHFRRENLLHMHMKHYHPEFSKYLDYTPSVTDLAYARTVGNLDAVEVPSPVPRKLAVGEKTEKSSFKAEGIRKAGEVFADSAKETKKLKSFENKSHPSKNFPDNSAPGDAVEEVADENIPKNKSSLSSVQSIRNIVNSNEREPVITDNKGNVSLEDSTEKTASLTENVVPSHSVMKSVKHHRLHNRKKTGRFQGSFSEHMRKKRFISQDRSRSLNKMGRHQLPQPPRQQLQQVQPLIPSQPNVEDSNSNTMSQTYALARYPKAHMNLSNEISGKNTLLTSCKSLSPVSQRIIRKRKYSSESSENSIERSNVTKTKLVDVFKERYQTEFERKKCKNVKRNKPSADDRRSFLTGLINARKRKRKVMRNRIRKKSRKSLRIPFEPSDSWMKNEAGHSQYNEKPDEMKDESFSTNIVDENSIKHDNESLVSSSNKDLDFKGSDKKTNKSERAQTVRSLAQRKNVKLQIKCLAKENGNAYVNNSETERSNYTESSLCSSEPVTFIRPSQVTNDLNSVENLIDIENDDSLETRLSKTDKDLEFQKNPPNLYKNDREKKGTSEGNIENEDMKNSCQSFEFKLENSVNNSPKSGVLLENVCRKETHLKPVNVSKRENDENVRSCNLSNKAYIKRKSKKKNKSRKVNRSKSRRQMVRKKVRFENTVTEKWINEEEGDEFNNAKVSLAESHSKNKSVRREERRSRQTERFQPSSYKSVEAERLDDCSRDEKLIPNNLTSVLDQAEGTEDSKSPLAVENDKIEKLRRNEIINCPCGITEEDGLMIQCDLCLCWQHGHCAGILRELDVPDKYTCAICKNPYRARSSMKYLHDQEWLKEGTLPSLSFRSKRDDIISQRRTILKRSHDLSGSIALLAQVVHSLRVKVNIAEKKDHPKLWLWAKKWTEKKSNRLKEESDIKEERIEEQNVDLGNAVKAEGTEDEMHLPKAPEPEAPIDSAECRLNLLDHLIHYQTLIDARLSCIESLVAELESMQDDAVNDEAPDRYPRTKATVQMILRDLSTMKKIATI